MKALAIKLSGILLSVLMFPVLGGVSCNEHLPPYADPADVLDLSLDIRYVLSLSMNEMHIDFVLTNRYDETLQAPASITGTGSIVVKRDSSRHCTFTIGVSNVVNGYDPQGGVLTIDPHKSITLRYVWNFVDDSGRDLRTTFFIYYHDVSCPPPDDRQVAFQETFVVNGTVKVFEKIPAQSVGPAEFSMCHVLNYVLQNYCPIFDPIACKPST